MNKRALLDAVVAQLRAELKALTAAALETHAEATDAENKAENKYDTRGLEASYLAHGQSKAAEEAAQAVAQFEALSPRDFTATEPISLGALVSFDGGVRYFVGPRAGGTEVKLDDAKVMVVTPQSPLGRGLLGRRQGDTVTLDLAGRRTTTRIAAVQ